MRRRSTPDVECPEWARDAALLIWQQLEQIMEATRVEQKSHYRVDADLNTFIDRVSSLIAYHIPENRYD